MKGLKNKLLALTVLISSFAVMSCSDFTEVNGTNGGKNNENRAYLHFSVINGASEGSSNSRTITPDSNVLRTDDISEVNLTYKEGTELKTAGTWTTDDEKNAHVKFVTDTSISLEAGTYSLYLEYKNSIFGIIYTASTTATLKEGTNKVTFNLAAPESGTGALKVNFDMLEGDGVTALRVSLFSLSKSSTQSLPEPKTVAVEDGEAESVEFTSIPYGFYGLKVEALNDDATVIKVSTDTVKICCGRQTEGTVTITNLNSIFAAPSITDISDDQSVTLESGKTSAECTLNVSLQAGTNRIGSEPSIWGKFFTGTALLTQDELKDIAVADNRISEKNLELSQTVTVTETVSYTFVLVYYDDNNELKADYKTTKITVTKEQSTTPVLQSFTVALKNAAKDSDNREYLTYGSISENNFEITELYSDGTSQTGDSSTYTISPMPNSIGYIPVVFTKNESKLDSVTLRPLVKVNDTAPFTVAINTEFSSTPDAFGNKTEEISAVITASDTVSTLLYYPSAMSEDGVRLSDFTVCKWKWIYDGLEEELEEPASLQGDWTVTASISDDYQYLFVNSTYTATGSLTLVGVEFDKGGFISIVLAKDSAITEAVLPVVSGWEYSWYADSDFTTAAIGKKVSADTKLYLKCTAEAAETELPAYVSGQTLSKDSYQISTAASLVALADWVNNSNETFSDKQISVVSDIDLTDIPWTPVQGSNEGFQGTFSGNNHIISNMNINSSNQYLGLFGEIKDATIKGVKLAGTVVSTYKTTNDCFAAGLVAYASGDVVISDCIAAVNVTASQRYAGGIVAKIGGSTGTKTIQNCENRGNIIATGAGSYYGGIAGYTEGTVSISNCANYGKIGGAAASICGGITGLSSEDKEVTIYTSYDNCFNAGTVTTADSDKQGALIGSNQYYTVTPFITNCYYLADSSTLAAYQYTDTDLGVNTFSVNADKSGSSFASDVTATVGESTKTSSDLLTLLNFVVTKENNSSTIYAEWEYCTDASSDIKGLPVLKLNTASGSAGSME